MDCAVIGDSLAVGISSHRPACFSQSTVGITTDQFISRYQGSIPAKDLLISLGSNDGPSAMTEDALRRVRARASESTSVTWLLSPNNNTARDIVQRIARERGDRIIDPRPWVGSDGVHPSPSGYFRIAAMWRSR